MMENETLANVDEWQSFVLTCGWRTPAHHLAAVLQIPEVQIQRARIRPIKRDVPLTFPELFTMWRGHAPAEQDWPMPKKRRDGNYEWLAPEDGLLATLVGQVGPVDIAATLTARLRSITQDLHAERTTEACKLRINRIGLQTSDLVGGITVAEAARQVGSRQVVQQAIRDRRLHTNKVGRYLLIPHAIWASWKAQRKAPPEGKVRLSTLREPLGIRSDSKLPEFAVLGYIPTAELFVAYEGVGRGEWYVAKDVAEQLLEDRRRGLAMPWHGKPLLLNLKQTYRLWQQRIHPATCPTCRHIWGPEGAPTTFESYCTNYPRLDHGAKRHLTREWTPGLTFTQAAEQASLPESAVSTAVANGVLQATHIDGVMRITQTDVTRWIARRCPSGDGAKSWISMDFAQRLYGFSLAELDGYVAEGVLRQKLGGNGPMRGVKYVLKQQCSDLRARLGYTVAEAATRAGVPLERMLQLLDGVQWRSGDRVPLVTLQAVIKRIKSKSGYSIDEAAASLNRPSQWVQDRIADGTIRVHTAAWNPGRIYVSEPMMRRLRNAAAAGVATADRLGPEWLNLTASSNLAGVSLATFRKWHDAGEMESKASTKGPLFHEQVVKQRATRYWHAEVRFKRAVPPPWYSTSGVVRAEGKHCGS